MADDESGSSLVSPCSAGDLKKGTIAMIKGHPCKVMEIRVSKTGKHGHAKCSITAVCVLTNKKYTDVQPAHANMFMANCLKKEYQLMTVDSKEKTASVLDDENNELQVSLEGETGEALIAEKEANPDDDDNDYIVSILTAPEEISEGVFVKKELCTGYKKQKATPL